jgi:steroid delta-isomerase-like uncharacterized protein
MTVEHNKAVVRRFYIEVINQRQLERLPDLVTDDVVEHYAIPGQKPGIQGLQEFLRLVLAAFPDVQATIEELIGDGPFVVARLRFVGSHRGEFFGVPATNRPVAWSAIHMVRLADGRIAERWAMADVMGIMKQIGAL